MKNSKIEYCDETANFVTGCTHRCPYCYAKKMAKRMGSMNKNTVYRRLVDAGEDPFHPAFHHDVLRKLKDRLENIKEPRRIFISSMGDIGCKTFFHTTDFLNGRSGVAKGVLTTSIVLQWVRRLCEQFPHHTFLLLSKNPKMLQPFEWPDNAHVGTSIDSADNFAHARLQSLHGVSAKFRWVSIEPLLDPAFDPHILQVGHRFPQWIVIGGLSNKKPLPAGCDRAAEGIIKWGKRNNVSIFCKDNLPRLSIDAPKEYP